MGDEGGSGKWDSEDQCMEGVQWLSAAPVGERSRDGSCEIDSDSRLVHRPSDLSHAVDASRT
jgi:hypothetical protein